MSFVEQELRMFRTRLFGLDERLKYVEDQLTEIERKLDGVVRLMIKDTVAEALDEHLEDYVHKVKVVHEDLVLPEETKK